MQTNYLKSLKYGLYVIFHPFKGFYELKYEKQGTLRAGLTFILLLYITYGIRALVSGYIFNAAQGMPINFLGLLFQIIAPYFLFMVANWCLTLMFDGEGTMAQIGMGICYSIIPLIFANALISILSNMLIWEEAIYIAVIENIAYLWTGFLILISVMQINQYTFLRAVVCSVLTIVGIGVILFIGLLCFNLVQQFLAFIESLYKEIVFKT